MQLTSAPGRDGNLRDDSSQRSSEVVLTVQDLEVRIHTRRGAVRAVDGVSLDLRRGEALGVVGESGCGKTITLRSIVGLLPSKATIKSGQILYEGQDLARLTSKALRKVRGTNISMIFQEPMTALNPTMRIGDQIAEGPMRRLGLKPGQAKREAVELLSLVGIPEAERKAQQYPHEFSGGMRQRVVIAIALACNPNVVLCDEPTTAVDVTIQAQILKLLTERRLAQHLSLILVTHDLAVVAETCERVVVMYAGRVVEARSVAAAFTTPRHPYTMALLRSIPSIEAPETRLESIAGMPPSLIHPPAGCRFAPRCRFATEACTTTDVPLLPTDDGGEVACLHQERVAEELSRRPIAIQEDSDGA